MNSINYTQKIIRIKKIIIFILFFFGYSLSATAQDKWKINVGSMLVTNFETQLQLTPKNIPLSARINTKDQLGMKSDTGIFRLDAYYRFNDTHRIDFSYFSVNSKGNIVIDKDLTWDDKIISAGAFIKSYFNMDTYKVNYGYSFYHNEKVELMLTAGLHITSLDLGLEANGIVDGVQTNAFSSASGATLPLPVIGFKGNYTIIDKTLFMEYTTDYFVLAYDKFKGSLLSSALNLEYRFVEHVGVGIGYNVNKIYFEAEDEEKKFEVNNELSGILLYFSYIY